MELTGKKLVLMLLIVVIMIVVGLNFYLSTQKDETKKKEPTVESTANVEPKKTTDSTERTNDSTTTGNEAEKKETAEETLEDFLKTYTTYDRYGDNYSTYAPYLSEGLQETIKKRLEEEKSKTDIESLGSSHYKSSELFSRALPNGEQKFITRIVSSVKAGNRMADTETSIIFTLRKDKTEQWIIEEMKPIRITENYY